MKYLIAHGANPHANNEEPLENAVYNNKLDAVKYLIEEQKANPHINNDRLLVVAVRNESQSKNLPRAAFPVRHGQMDMVKYLVETHKLSPSANPDAIDTAELNEDIDMIKYLMEHGADASQLNLEIKEELGLVPPSP
jgi:ankyrin repeat protein